jgi:hypothetical protein
VRQFSRQLGANIGLCPIYFCAVLFSCLAGHGQELSNTNARIAVLELEESNAVAQVEKIINQPVLAYKRQRGMRVSEYKNGWFHPGASIPNFSKVDVRTTQETPYDKFQYITSDQNPGLAFVGNQLEFNANTKYFYKNRSLPKKKLTEPEMLEINRLYRIIGRCRTEILNLKEPQSVEISTSADNPETTSAPGESTVPGPPLAVSAQTRSRLLYGGIGVLALALVLLLFRKIKA